MRDEGHPKGHPAGHGAPACCSPLVGAVLRKGLGDPRTCTRFPANRCCRGRTEMRGRDGSCWFGHWGCSARACPGCTASRGQSREVAGLHSTPRAARGGAGQELRQIKPSARLLGAVPGARGSASSTKPLVAPNSQLILFLLIPQSSLSGLREPVCFLMNNTAQRGGCSGIM